MQKYGRKQVRMLSAIHMHKHTGAYKFQLTNSAGRKLASSEILATAAKAAYRTLGEWKRDWVTQQVNVSNKDKVSWIDHWFCTLLCAFWVWVWGFPLGVRWKWSCWNLYVWGLAQIKYFEDLSTGITWYILFFKITLHCLMDVAYFQCVWPE